MKKLSKWLPFSTLLEKFGCVEEKKTASLLLNFELNHQNILGYERQYRPIRSL